MSCFSCLTILAALPVLLGLFIYYYINTFSFGTIRIPDKLLKDGYYGRGDPKTDDISIEPYKFNVVSDQDIEDLRDRLNKTRFNQPLEDSKDFSYGFNSDYLKIVTNYWANQFDWRKQEKKIKAFDHFQTQIEGLNIHFIHIKPGKSKKKTVPLLLVNGWPSNFYEYLRTLEEFNKNNDSDNLSYELIVPSIPGFGFSEKPHKKGFNTAECARIFNKLMVRLSFDKYYVHGSDWGSMITRFMASMYPTRVLGYHTTTAFPKYDGRFFVRTLLARILPTLMLDNPELEKPWLFCFYKQFPWILRETGYMHIQSTKPDTVATGLNDSPAGLAAYILEKYTTWTSDDFRLKSDGHLTKKYSLDDLLTIVSLYWFNQNINYSQRLYKETFANFGLQLPVEDVPAGITHTGNGMLLTPFSFFKTTFTNLVYTNHLDDGGHFYALEDPKTFASEVIKFIHICEGLN